MRAKKFDTTPFWLDMSIVIEPFSALGYAKAPDNLQVHTRLAVYHRGRIWALSCSVKNGDREDSLPGTEVRLAELTSLVFALFVHRGKASLKQATTRFRKRLYQSRMGDHLRGRL